MTTNTNTSPTRIRAGLYRVGDYIIERRYDLPGRPWRITDDSSFFDPFIDDADTLADALDIVARNEG